MQSNTFDENINSKNKTVVVGISGGVDSSVVALLLKNQGYNVVGLHMKNANGESEEDDIKMIESLAEKIGINFVVKEYDDEMQKVKDYFENEYFSGRTPNPCVMCNKWVKFKPFIDYADEIGADFFATGHYANIERLGDKIYLKRAEDLLKDQSYFLNQLSQNQLNKAMFPLGKLTKEQVKKIAQENNLIMANRKESFDVCFLGNQKLGDYIYKIDKQKSGDIVDDVTGKVVGKHQGLSKFTIGQRKGLGIGGGHGQTGDCWFVVRKDVKNNKLYVAQGDDDTLYSDALISNNFNWTPEIPSQKEFECTAKFRYRQQDQKVKVKINDDGSVYIEFAEKQRAITTGQYVVLYKEDENSKYDNCLGGGSIDKVIKNGKIIEI